MLKYECVHLKSKDMSRYDNSRVYTSFQTLFNNPSALIWHETFTNNRQIENNVKTAINEIGQMNYRKVRTNFRKGEYNPNY